MSKFHLNHRFKGAPTLMKFIDLEVDFQTGKTKLEVLQSTGLKKSRDKTSERINFLQTWFKRLVSQFSDLRAIYWSRDRHLWISNWEYFSLHSWKRHVIDLKIWIFGYSKFITFVQVWFSLVLSKYLVLIIEQLCNLPLF